MVTFVFFLAIKTLGVGVFFSDLFSLLARFLFARQKGSCGALCISGHHGHKRAAQIRRGQEGYRYWPLSMLHWRSPGLRSVYTKKYEPAATDPGIITTALGQASTCKTIGTVVCLVILLRGSVANCNLGCGVTTLRQARQVATPYIDARGQPW